MAQSVKIAGALFSNVPSIQVPDENDVFHPFVDPSPTTATAADVASGKIFIAADGTQTTGTASGGSATIVSKTITANGTYNASADSADGYDPVIVNVAGGLPVLATKSLGAFSNVSTTEAVTGQSLEVPSVTGYDYLLIVASCEGETGNQYICTSSIVYLEYSTSRATLSASNLMSIRTNTRNKNGVIASSTSSTAYGFFPKSASYSGDTVTLPISVRRGSSTGTINGNITIRAYGINAYALA